MDTGVVERILGPTSLCIGGSWSNPVEGARFRLTPALLLPQRNLSCIPAILTAV